MGLYTHIKAGNLFSPSNRQVIVCDEDLKNLFGVNEFELKELVTMLSPHLSPPDPIEILYPLRLGDCTSHSEVFDIETDFDILHDESASLPGEEIEKDIHNLQEDILILLEKLEKHREERRFMTRFSKDPVRELNSQIADQIRESRDSKG